MPMNVGQDFLQSTEVAVQVSDEPVVILLLFHRHQSGEGLPFPEPSAEFLRNLGTFGRCLQNLLRQAIHHAVQICRRQVALRGLLCGSGHNTQRQQLGCRRRGGGHRKRLWQGNRRRWFLSFRLSFRLSDRRSGGRSGCGGYVLRRRMRGLFLGCRRRGRLCVLIRCRLRSFGTRRNMPADEVHGPPGERDQTPPLGGRGAHKPSETHRRYGHHQQEVQRHCAELRLSGIG